MQTSDLSYCWGQVPVSPVPTSGQPAPPSPIEDLKTKYGFYASPVAICLANEEFYNCINDVCTQLGLELKQCRSMEEFEFAVASTNPHQPVFAFVDYSLMTQDPVDSICDMFNKHLSYSIILLKKYNLAGQSSAKPHPMLPIEFMLLPVSKNDLRAKLDEFFVKTYYLNKMLSKIRNLEKLNEREWILVQLVSFGMPNKQSANILTLAEKTIEKCRTGIYRKLGVHSTGELASLVSIANFYQWPVGVEFPRKR